MAAESGFWVPATCADWSEQELLERLQPVFADADKEAIAHHFKFDYKVLAIRGLAFHNKVFDTMVAHYLIQPQASTNSIASPKPNSVTPRFPSPI